MGGLKTNVPRIESTIDDGVFSDKDRFNVVLLVNDQTATCVLSIWHTSDFPEGMNRLAALTPPGSRPPGSSLKSTTTLFLEW